MAAPYIFIHKGYSSYLPLSLNRAMLHRGEAEVHLLGNSLGKLCAKQICTHASEITEFAEEASKFEDIYDHHSTLGYEFELFCIQRWFILRSYMQTINLQNGIYLDTDILLTKPLEPLRAETEVYGTLLAFTGYSAHTCYINQLVGLEQFCDFVTDFYNDSSTRTIREKFAREHKEKYGEGGVSDMTLFRWFQHEAPDSIASFTQVNPASGMQIDLSIADTHGYVADNRGFKRLDWDDTTPFATTDSNQRIEMAALHFQGEGKAILNEVFLKLGGSPITIGFSKIVDFIFRFLRKAKLINSN